MNANHQARWRCERRHNLKPDMALILIIEDEAPIRANLVRFIELEGHQAFEAENGQVGLHAAMEKRPDLIICDVTMPLMNGREVLSALQNEPTLKKIPFVFLSASAEPERFEEARRLGAVAYITKPFGFTQLRTVLQKHLPKQ
jgi:CheY-like chemotaxis protein